MAITPTEAKTALDIIAARAINAPFASDQFGTSLRAFSYSDHARADIHAIQPAGTFTTGRLFHDWRPTELLAAGIPISKLVEAGVIYAAVPPELRGESGLAQVEYVGGLRLDHNLSSMVKWTGDPIGVEDSKPHGNFNVMRVRTIEEYQQLPKDITEDELLLVDVTALAKVAEQFRAGGREPGAQN